MTIVRYISGLIWQTRSTYFLVLLFLLLESAANYSLIYVQKILIDEIFYVGKYEWTPAVVAAFALIGVLHAVMITVTFRQLVSNEFKVSGVLIDRMLRSLENTKVGAFTKERHGNFVHIMTSDLFFGASFIGWQTPRAIQEAMSLAIMIGVVSWASPTLLLIVIVLCLLYLAVTWYFMSKLARFQS